jgi:hypothetical protein
MREIEFAKKDSIRVIAEVASFIDSLDDTKQYKLTIAEKKKKRSLDANSYFWLLCDKLAEKTRIPKTEIYRSYIKEIGGVSDTVCVLDKAVDKLCDNWEKNGLGWQTDRYKSKMKGCTNVVLYYGSSTYDSKQMSRLIELIVQDCLINEIETLPPEQLQALNNEWGKR